MSGRTRPPVSLRVPAFAKINLALRVLGRRADGYHELDTVFQTIGLHDLIDIELDEKGAEGSIHLEVPAGGAPEDESNLAWQAAASFVERWQLQGAVRLRLWKRVPAAAGLGGGSADAAAVLRGLAELARRRPPAPEMSQLASAIGSDVPFFLHGGTARASGRGDRIAPLEDLEAARLLVAVPAAPVTTASVFRSLNWRQTHRHRSPGIAAPATRDLREWLQGNDLESVVLGGYPQVATVYNRLQEFGLGSIQLSGSGGALFAVVDQDFEETSIRSGLEGIARVWLTETVPRREALRIERLEKGVREWRSPM